MKNSTIHKLIKSARKTFLIELEHKINDMDALLTGCEKYGCTENEALKVLRFFHSVNGTASTLGMEQLASAAGKLEALIKERMDREESLEQPLLELLHSEIIRMKKSIFPADRTIIPENLTGTPERNKNAPTIIEPDKRNEPIAKVPETIREGEGNYTNIKNRGKILLVDDDVTILKLLENALTLEGYDVLICDEPVTALDTLAVSKPDMVILDVLMPGMDGYKLLERIKAKSEFSDIQIIFLSSVSDVESKIRGLKSGADEYLTKPFVIDEVLIRIEAIFRRVNKAREKLLHDDLTGAYSRYCFNRRIAEETERYKRSKQIFSIVSIDLDHFKELNDRYGYQTGDIILQKFASFLKKHIRKYDSLYRLRGEKFAILLPNTDESAAFQIIERLRECLLIFPMRAGGAEITVTFSAGIARISSEDITEEQLIGNADRAMYLAKKHGRNKVVIYSKDAENVDLRKTILIVDDENAILKLLRDRMSDLGYKTITVRDGSSAIETAKEVHPDLVVLDLMLPDVDGYQVCRHIKEDAASASVKVIILSKMKGRKTIAAVKRYGADDYLAKPFSMAELEARIMRLLNI